MGKFLFAFAFIFSCISSVGMSQNQVMQTGEYLKYEVSFLGVKLGSIETFVDGSENFEGKSVWNTRSVIKTYQSIPFVSIDATFRSLIDRSVTFSHDFMSNINDGNNPPDILHTMFDYEKKQIRLDKFKGDKLIEQIKFDTDKKWNDGGSLFFVARRLLTLKKTVRIPTIIDQNQSQTIINFHNKKENITTKSIGYPVKTIFIDGVADWEGLYGLKGKFEAWFCDDISGIPIKAKMNVYVGSVDIELVEWKRKGWEPPKAK